MRALFDNKKSVAGLVIVAAFVLLAIFGPLVVQDPDAFIAVPHDPPSGDHWLGTTGQGQDVLAQTIAGARITLLVGFVVGFAVTFISALVGTAAGYFSGFVDDALTLMINLFLVMPGLPLMVVLAAYLPPGPVTIAAVLTFTGWSWSARVLRAQTLSLREKDFVAAAIVGGESNVGVIFREILPNMTSILVSGFIGATVYAIGAQVGLEFLGLGDVGTVTWGTNLYWASNDLALLTGSWWTYVPTGICVALVGFALVMINFGIDEISNPRLRSETTWVRFVRGAGLESVGSSTPVVRRAQTNPAPDPKGESS